jgi:HAD superfamily hydrolase (TIGR01509 family)
MRGDTVIRGLIFDFDGLILDTESGIYQSWLELYREFGVDLPLEEWAQIIGVSPEESFDPFEKLEARLGRSLDGESLRKRRAQRERELLAAQAVLPGVEDYLDEAERLGLKLAIASSSSRKWVGRHLKRLGLSRFFEAVHTCDDVERSKPDPALYRLALSSLSLKPEEVIVFEDSPNGVMAAQRAGLFCVAVPNALTGALPLDHADFLLESLSHLPLEDLIAAVDRKMAASSS